MQRHTRINVRDTTYMVYSIGIRLGTLSSNTMDTTHFVFDTNAMIQRVRVGDMRVRVSYKISLHNIRLRNSNHWM